MEEERRMREVNKGIDMKMRREIFNYVKRRGGIRKWLWVNYKG